MFRLLAKLHLERYFNAKFILCIDLAISFVASLFVLLFLQLIVKPSYLFGEFSLFWLAGTIAACLLWFAVFSTYRTVIRHSTLREVARFTSAILGKELTLVLLAILMGVGDLSHKLIISIAIIDGFISLGLLIMVRVLMIIAYDLIKSRLKVHRKRLNILIYGTRDKSVAQVTRLHDSSHYNVMGFLTLGKQLKNHSIANCKVYYFENEASIKFLKERFEIDAVLFATADEAKQEQERLIRYCVESDVKVLFAPPIDEVVDGKIMKQSIREIKIEDLLGRPEIKISMHEIIENFQGKTIMVTGSAGSIGSELCRQLATFGIRELILFDNAETPMHNIRLELEERFPELKFTPVIGDVRQPARLDYAFRTFKPQVVFHAAAYKHVPLMEENPCEAVYVNVAGSRAVADKCIEYGVEKMVMISTDKAVNPTNIMGCTKRLAEIYVQSLGLAIEQGTVKGKTKFVTTRFGNVLGSNGSVIPRFREQIAKGGPITVTHPEITRFFMTIPEACRLVMEAATMTSGNQIFVFDMGESVKIADLAKRMVKLAGLTLDEDIKIEYTGLRPGEKLYEEVLSNAENTEATEHDRIRIAKVREYNYADAVKVVEELESLAHDVEIPAMVRLMKRTVPEFKSKNSQYEEYDKEFENRLLDRQL